MPRSTSFVLAASAVLCGLTASAFTMDPAGVQARDDESPLGFLMRQHRQSAGDRDEPDYYVQEPVRVQRPVSAPRKPPVAKGAQRGAAKGAKGASVTREFKRAVCRRTCDGEQLVLGFVSSREEEKNAEAMCAVAGGGAPTAFALEKFAPAELEMFALAEEGTTEHEEGAAEPIASSSLALIEGRASLSTGAAARPVKATGNCAAGSDESMMVPILHDTTLRHGDVVATKSGFKVFVGKGKAPFREKDFVAIEQRRKISKDLRKLKIADR